MPDPVDKPETLIAAATQGAIGGARSLGRHAHRYAPAYLRGVLYIVSAAIINFGETFGKLTPEDAAKLSALGWVCLVLKPVNAAAIAAIAFLDQTLARINTARAQEESRPPFHLPTP